MTGQQLVAQGYMQISRKYRLFARIPDGKTGKQALLEASRAACVNEKHYEVAREWMSKMFEHDAARYYRRVYAPHYEASIQQMTEFKAAGGKTA